MTSLDQGKYSIGLDKTPANFVPLSPLSFLERTAAVYPDLTSTIHEGRHFTWAQTYERCRRFASYLARQGIGRGDTVAAMLPNIPAMNEAHFAVPMAGAVLNALNIRLDAASIAFQLDHGGARIILVDPEFAGVIAEALTVMAGAKPMVIDVDDRAPRGRELPVREGLTRIIVDWSGSWQAARPGNWLGRSPATKAALGR
jgi:fatty-acyl-CoA synthase